MSELNPEQKQSAYAALSDNELIELAISWKEQAKTLRENIWRVEDELRNRLLFLNATKLETDQFRVKASTKREVTWDQGGISVAGLLAIKEGRGQLFNEAFRQEWKPNLTKVKSLLTFGGETAKAVEAAKIQTTEKMDLSYEQLA